MFNKIDKEHTPWTINYYPKANQSQIKLTKLEAPKPTEPGFWKKAFWAFITANIALQEDAKVYQNLNLY